MDVKQVYNLVNDATKEVLGESVILAEDLTNVVELGTAVFNANAMDKYVKSLVNHIGRVIFVNRAYRGGVPSVLMDRWEFGSVLEKVSADLLSATENESWELENGTSYDPNIFYKPSVSAKFFNKLVTFEVPVSIAEKQVKQSFSDATQLNAFVSMIYTAVENTMIVKIDSLIMRTINNFIAETMYDEFPSGTYSGVTSTKAVNLLYLYNTEYGTNLTKAVALHTPEFLRFASNTISIYKDRIAKISKLFNIGEKERFTLEGDLHIVALSDFAKASDTYLQSDVRHNELTKLPNGIETVAYWQGTGTSYAFGDISKVNVKTSANHDVECDGILAVMFDRNALGVCNSDRRVTTNYNPKAEFFTNFYKFDAEYFNDQNENFVVFYVA